MGVAAGLLITLTTACIPDAPPVTSGTSAATQPLTALFGGQVGSSETATATPAGFVYFLRPEGPAAAAGVREGDLILSLGGVPISSEESFIEALRRQQPDSVVPVAVIRDGQPLELKVKLGRRGSDAEEARLWRNLMLQRTVQELAAAAEAQRLGDHPAALAHGAQAARAAFDAASVSDIDQALVQLGATLQSARTTPPVPPEADRRNRRAIAILGSASSDRDNDRAAQEFFWAIFAAPWIADLYLNRGLVLARAGFPREASLSLRRYLLLSPRAADTASVRGKIAELEVASEDQTPWLSFLTDWKTGRGGTYRIGLRNQELTATILTPDPDTDQKPGDRLCWGTVRGLHFEGKCTTWFSTDTAKACFGSKREYEADGDIAGDELKIDTITGLNFNTTTCAINSETRGHRIWVRKPQSS